MLRGNKTVTFKPQFTKNEQCKFCNDKFDKEYMVNVHHNFNRDDLCHLYKDYCPNNCRETDKVIWREHRRICTGKCGKCPYQSIGCESVEIKEKDMTKHLHEESYKHTYILLDHISNLNNELTSVRKELNDLKKSVSEIHANINFLTILARLEEIDSNNQSSEERINKLQMHSQNLNGVYLWKIVDFEYKHQKRMYSPPFYTHHQGYKMQLELCKKGNRNGKYISIYAKLMKGEYDFALKWPFMRMVTIVILDQERRNRNYSHVIYFDDEDDECCQRPEVEFGKRNGVDEFITEDHLNSLPHLLECDDMWINCYVDELN